ncbi:MAG: transposase [Gemmatimonadaceae bacterium]
MLCWDETGHTFRIWMGRTWARRGETPVVRRLSRRREISSRVGITPDGRLYARHQMHAVNTPAMLLALQYVRHQIATPLLSIWDRWNAHHRRAVMEFLNAHP